MLIYIDMRTSHMRFTVQGHKNMRATHAKTLEFTKDTDLSVRGDCIVGVNADFDPEKLKSFIKDKKHIKVTLSIDDLSDSFEAEINPEFDDEHEIVFRLGSFSSGRTLSVSSTKAAIHLKRDIVKKLEDPSSKMTVEFEVK